MMKLNWGHKITLVFIAFVALMLTLVYKSMKTDFDLVSKEYYKDELAFQDVIDGKNNAFDLTTATSVSANNEQVLVQLPEEMKNKTIEGSVWFYCPANADNDKRMALKLNNDAQFSLPAKEFNKANYIVKIQWLVDGKKYYVEQPLTVN